MVVLHLREAVQLSKYALETWISGLKLSICLMANKLI
jgi:hypothetical protein